MFEKDDETISSDSVNSKGGDGNVGNSKIVKLNNEDNDNENEVEEDTVMILRDLWHQQVQRL